MAKKRKKARKPSKRARQARAHATGAQAVAALESALPSDIKVIAVPAGAAVSVDVDVNDMAVPYTIALDTRALIKSLVDSREDLPAMAAGTHRLSWGFAHAVKEWKHKITLTVGAAKTVLEEKSEAKKDPDQSIGVAFLIVS
jgi:hypothetical protein